MGGHFLFNKFGHDFDALINLFRRYRYEGQTHLVELRFIGIES